MSTQQLATPDGLTAHVASEIRAMMGRLNVNRAELARRLSVEDSWVGKRLSGRTKIDLDDFGKIAEALGVGVVDLLPRDRRQATNEYPEDDVMPGVHALPTHPIHGAVSLPRQIRQTTPPVTESPRRVILTAPHPLSLPL